MISDQDLDAMEAAARAATPGPWRLRYGRAIDGGPPRPTLNGDGDLCHVAFTDSADGQSGPSNGRYIATAHPAAVLALIAEVRVHRAGAAVESHRMFCGQCSVDPTGRSCAEGMQLREAYTGASAARERMQEAPARLAPEPPSPRDLGTARHSPSGVWCPVDFEPCDCGAPIGSQCPTKRPRP